MVEIPEVKSKENCLICSKGHFMGGNVRIAIDYVVYVQPKKYMDLNISDQYTVARHIGKLNALLKDKKFMLMGPGRWGTSTPSLGVPVHFAELNHAAIMCEIASLELGIIPELSYGSHFFQDLVESGIFYAAIREGQSDVVFNPSLILNRSNALEGLLPSSPSFLQEVIHVVQMTDLHLYSDVVSQRLVCMID